MLILGIETSCDETAAAVVEDGTEILSSVVASSAEMHAKTGGIIPEQAARQQVISIVPVIEQALVKAFEVGSLKWEARASHLSHLTSKIDALAVTVGPGLIGSLLVGVETAKTLSYLWGKPIIPVNHLAAHIYANWLTPNSKLKTSAKGGSASGGQDSKPPAFPALALVVSGGHTDLVLLKGHPSTSRSARAQTEGSGQANIEWIGGTRDDAAGEAFDKTARLLGLGYPGGPEISKKASYYLPHATNPKLDMFPRPMVDEDNFDFSFSGLKTSAMRELTNQQINKSSIPKLAAEIQEAIVDVLVEKTLKAVHKYKPKSLLLAGGVAANKRLRQKFQLGIRNSKFDISFFVPPPNLCTDNATYIAGYAHFNHSPTPWEKIKANPGLTITGQL